MAGVGELAGGDAVRSWDDEELRGAFAAAFPEVEGIEEVAYTRGFEELYAASGLGVDTREGRREFWLRLVELWERGGLG